MFSFKDLLRERARERDSVDFVFHVVKVLYIINDDSSGGSTKVFILLLDCFFRSSKYSLRDLVSRMGALELCSQDVISKFQDFYLLRYVSRDASLIS